MSYRCPSVLCMEEVSGTATVTTPVCAAPALGGCGGAGAATGPGSTAAGELAESRAGAALGLLDRRTAVSAGVEALRELRSVLTFCATGELAPLAGELAELRALAGAGLVAVTAEAESRGVIEASQCASTAEWVADSAWFSRRESATVAKAAALLLQADYEPVADAVAEGDVDLNSAVVVGAEFAKLAPDLIDAAKPVVLGYLLDAAAEHGPAAVRRLKDEILARYGSDGDFEEQEERRRRQIELTAGRQTPAGMWDYQLTLDPEGRAVLEAVIGPGSAPAPNLDTGARDMRSMARRRGEALVEALRRSVTATAHVPTSPKSVLMLTMRYDDLAARLPVSGPSTCAGVSSSSIGASSIIGANAGGHGSGSGTAVRVGGVVVGSRADGTLLSHESVRRIACDAGVIPVILGAHGEILDQGRMQRLFTTSQVRALWLRDRHCTFAGCDVPAAWCDAHHLVHWIDGGPTDISNGALLCGRHHTIVHRDQLAGQLRVCTSTEAGALSEELHIRDGAGAYRPDWRGFEPLGSRPGGRQPSGWRLGNSPRAEGETGPPRSSAGSNSTITSSGVGPPRKRARSNSTGAPATIGVTWDRRPGSYQARRC